MTAAFKYLKGCPGEESFFYFSLWAQRAGIGTNWDIILTQILVQHEEEFS